MMANLSGVPVPQGTTLPFLSTSLLQSLTGIRITGPGHGPVLHPTPFMRSFKSCQLSVARPVEEQTYVGPGSASVRSVPKLLRMYPPRALEPPPALQFVDVVTFHWSRLRKPQFASPIDEPPLLYQKAQVVPTSTFGTSHFP